MPDIKSIIPNFDAVDAHIIRRLGAAIVAQWDNLPEGVQTLLIEQACLMEDGQFAIHSRESISVFIKRHKGWGTHYA